MPTKTILRIEILLKRTSLHMMFGLLCLTWCVPAQDATLRQEATQSPVRVAASADWKAVDFSNPWPLKGSALDLSRFVENAPVGTYGHVLRTPEGHLAFERRPGQRAPRKWLQDFSLPAVTLAPCGIM